MICCYLSINDNIINNYKFKKYFEKYKKHLLNLLKHN